MTNPRILSTDSSDRRNFLLGSAALGASALFPSPALGSGAPAPASTGADTRAEWLGYVKRVSDPVLKALSRRELRKVMPVEAAPGVKEARSVGTHLEALGRLISGIAPWLELEPSVGESAAETALRKQYREWSLAAITSSVDPNSPDYMR